jgi:hypothetical protein
MYRSVLQVLSGLQKCTVYPLTIYSSRLSEIVRNSESVIDTIVIVCDEKTSCYEFYIFVHVKLICTSVNKAIY